MQLKPHGLTEAPFHAIALDGFAQGFRDGESHFRAVLLLRLFETEGSEVSAGKTGTLIINFAEVAAAEDADTLRKKQSGQSKIPRGDKPG